jgi:uncharacterized membrane protein AbrB (regulator of aidB expression)
MSLLESTSSVTTALMAGFALFVVYIRMKGWLESNVPIFYYVSLGAYMRAVDGKVPFWLTCTGFALGLMLRFEFMNTAFTSTVKFLEIGVLMVIVYLSVVMILS